MKCWRSLQVIVENKQIKRNNTQNNIEIKPKQQQ